MRCQLFEIRRAYKSLYVIGILMLFPSLLFGRALFDSLGETNLAGRVIANNEPFVTVGVHDIGKIGITVSNQGHFGTGFIPGASNPFDGGPAPSCTYPYPGRASYLFAGSFWIGAVVERDTLVSVGADGWHGTRELWPDPLPRGRMIYRTITGQEKEKAVSEQDYIAIYTDTVTNPQYVGMSAPFDFRPHIPLNIEVTQRTYAWSYSYAEDFILFDYSIKNIGRNELNSVYMGFYVDGDVNTTPNEGYDDDICGFQREVPSNYGCGFIDTVNIAWIADNDGKTAGTGCPFNPNDALTSITGMRVVRTPSDSLRLAFNWWISNGDASRDFGPRKVGTPDDPFRDFGGFLGTPEGDKNKYYTMMHGEFDYDQLLSAVDNTADGWLPRNNELAPDFADGFDTRYLLSFGPFDIEPGEILPISFAYLAGENFHWNCEAFDNLFNPFNPYPFRNQLDFSDFGKNAMWASWIYDNPGYDTDGDGYSGKFRVCVFDSFWADTGWVYSDADTMYYEGDGVPDFKGATPPPAPELWIIDSYGDTVRSKIYPRVTENNSGELIVRWNGFRSETTKDVFSNEIDFEGYRVYLSNTLKEEDFILMASFDIEDYNKWIWNSARRVWVLKDKPFSLDSLRQLYGAGFDPLLYDIDHMFGWGDSTFYFSRQDWNQSDLTDPNQIHKVYNVPPPTILNLDSTRLYYPEELTEEGQFKYYEYEFIIRNLIPSRLYYVSVTAFDYGSPGSDLQYLETARTQNCVAEYALHDNRVIDEKGLNIIVFPNPYRADANYAVYGFEGLDYVDSVLGGILVLQDGLNEDRTGSIHFINLPHKCTIKIFSIDGDLIRQIDHDYPVDSPRSMHERWDLITRNTQTVVSGIYYYVVESDIGSQMGKLVIIK